MFSQASDPKGSEIDVLRGLGPEKARKALENHWDNFINEGDWRWMASHGVNTVRIPVGYFHVMAGSDNAELRSLLKGTEYAEFAEVYSGAWGRIVRAIETAAKHNIGVLVDVHAVPGAQNKDGHSGLSTGKAGLWHGLHASGNQRKTIEILVHLASAVAQHENVVGLELMNEPENNEKLEAFYDKAVKAIRTNSSPAAQSIPLYVGDAWATKNYAEWVGYKSNESNFLVLDHHLYRCFTSGDHSTAADAHAAAVDPGQNGHSARWLQDISNKCNGSLIIGEWSGALNPHSFEKSSIKSKLEARTLWSQAQWRAFEAHTAGYFYWTLKKEGGPDPGWCLYTAIEKGSMPPSLNPLFARGGQYPDPQRMARHVDEALGPYMHAHVSYWDQHNGHFEHWRFEAGFRAAWNDACVFLASGSEGGFSGQLATLRSAAHKKEQGDSSAVWEFEHGFKQGIEAFRRGLYG